MRFPGIALLLLSLTLPMQLVADADGQPVRIATVEKRPLVRTVSTYGVLAPKVEDLSFRIDGRIASFSAFEGQVVEADEVLAALETRDAEDRLDQARVQRDQAARQLERFQKLAEDRMIQASQLEEAVDRLETATINFETAALDLQRCSLRAPAKGVILKEYLDSRTTVSAGTPIYSFRDFSESWITEVELTDQNAFTFGVGTRALARFAPYPGEVFQGELTKQAGVADRNDGLYTVEITIVTEGRELRPGMVVEVDLIHETQENFTMVPLDALVDLRSNRGVVYVLDESMKTVKEVAVHIVAISGGWVALVEPIPPGASVVIRGQQSLRDNTRVRVI